MSLEQRELGKARHSVRAVVVSLMAMVAYGKDRRAKEKLTLPLLLNETFSSRLIWQERGASLHSNHRVFWRSNAPRSGGR